MKISPVAALIFLCLMWSCKDQKKQIGVIESSNILSFQVNPKSENIKFYWKNDHGEVIGSIRNLKRGVEQKGKKLIFAMNGGMYDKSQRPQGLYVENGIVKGEINRDTAGYGNFFLMPNGVFIIHKDNSASILKSSELDTTEGIQFATQSGPMLIHDGHIHSQLNKGSKNLHIRNGVGVLPNGNLLFAISKEEINFYDFASHFKNNGCQDALYLDGFVSRAYLPEKDWIQEDGNFGVIIGVIE